MTGDETGLYQYDPEDKIQLKQWLPRGRSGPVKAKSERSRGKVMATVFWDAEGIDLVDFLENKKTMTSAYYEGVLRKMFKKILYRENALESCINASSSNTTMHPLSGAHGARQTRAVIREFRWEIIRQPSYSPDLAPSDFFLFPK